MVIRAIRMRINVHFIVALAILGASTSTVAAYERLNEIGNWGFGYSYEGVGGHNEVYFYALTYDGKLSEPIEVANLASRYIDEKGVSLKVKRGPQIARLATPDTCFILGWHSPSSSAYGWIAGRVPQSTA